jgi:thiosulfate/3-mercaptopyruvate sulfurtransferase
MWRTGETPRTGHPPLTSRQPATPISDPSLVTLQSFVPRPSFFVNYNSPVTEKGYANPHLLVDPAALHAQLSAPAAGPLVVDTRSADQYAGGHIPGAVHLDLWGFSLIDTDPAPLRAFLWMIQHVIASRGIWPGRPVVVYDERSGVRAARVFWFLEYFGHPAIRMLDGGFGAWLREGLPVETAGRAAEPAAWTPEARPGVLATWRDVHERLASPDAVLLDTRSDDEYYGRIARAHRAGAVPGAVHVEWTRNLGPDGAFKPAAELRAMYEGAGAGPDREVVAYCQGGYRAAHAYLALRLLGYPRVRNYLGSWKEWGDRAELPIERPSPPLTSGP